MKIDFEKGAYIQIGGEIGRYNSIPIDFLVKFAQDLQKLIQTIAKYDLPENEPLNLDNFKIELVDFKVGSAIPKFAFSPREENVTGQNWQIHRKLVSERFEQLIEISDKGEYTRLKDLYPQPFKRNPIVLDLYDFTNDFGNSPVSFVHYDDTEGKIVPVFKLNKLKTGLKTELMTDIVEEEALTYESGIGVAKIRYTTRAGKIKKNIIDFYTGKKISLEFAPEVIVYKNRKYILKFPLRCLFEKEEDYFVIQSEMLNIIGTGMTSDEAEEAFSEEFDFVYNRFNSLDDKSLTEHNIITKKFINHIVDKVE